MTRWDGEQARRRCSEAKEPVFARSGRWMRRIRLDLKRLPAHRLASVHKHGAPYSCAVHVVADGMVRLGAPGLGG